MKTAIDVQDVWKSYSGIPAVRGMSMRVAQGEVFGLLGANGAGKSTSIECILGTKKADRGSAAILGLDPQQQRSQLFEQVGVQFQEASYPDKIKVGELCEETCCLYRKAADYHFLLNQLGLTEKEKNFVSELSGGEKQRLFIVLALIPNPKVVFLDELTTGLDPRARREVWKCLLEMKKAGLSILLTSHFMEEVELLCDRVAVLKKGDVVFCGTVNEMIRKSPYEELEQAYLWFTDEEEEIENL